MSEKTKQAGEALMEAFNNLPDSKKEFLLGYAEGVAAMTEKATKTPDTATAKYLPPPHSGAGLMGGKRP